MVPAGPRRRRVRPGRERQPGPRGRDARAARRGLRRDRRAARPQPDGDGRQRQPGAAAPRARRRRGRAAAARPGRRQDADALRREITPCGGDVVPPCWRGSPYQPVPVQEYAADDAAGLRRVLAIEEHREDFPAVDTRFAAVREYPQGRTAAHVLGYLGPISPEETGRAEYEGVQDDALVGRAGVEASYDAALRGRDGVQQLLVDHVGTVTGVAGETPPEPGDKLVLSLHAGVQKVAEQALERAVAARPDPPGPRRRRELQGRLRLDRGDGGQDRPDRRDGQLPVLRPVGLRRRGEPTRSTPSSSTSGRARRWCSGRSRARTRRRPRSRSSRRRRRSRTATRSAASTRARARTRRSAASATSRASGSGPITLRTAIVKSCDTIYYDFAYEQWLRDGGNDPVAQPEGPDGADGAALRARRPHRRRPAERAHRHDRRPGVPAAALGAAARRTTARARSTRSGPRSGAARTRSSARTATASAAATPRTSPSGRATPS